MLGLDFDLDQNGQRPADGLGIDERHRARDHVFLEPCWRCAAGRPRATGGRGPTSASLVRSALSCTISSSRLSSWSTREFPDFSMPIWRISRANTGVLAQNDSPASIPCPYASAIPSVGGTDQRARGLIDPVFLDMPLVSKSGSQPRPRRQASPEGRIGQSDPQLQRARDGLLRGDRSGCWHTRGGRFGGQLRPGPRLQRATARPRGDRVCRTRCQHHENRRHARVRRGGTSMALISTKPKRSREFTPSVFVTSSSRTERTPPSPRPPAPSPPR